MELSLGASVVEPLLTGRFGRPYVYAASCESTQALLSPDAPEGAVAVADEQTAGRGRFGREWQAPAGTSLLFSILLRPPLERGAPELTLVGAIAAARAIEEATELAVQIKWPNDVMLDRRKVAGILGDLRDEVVVLGVGINVNQAPGQLPGDARVTPGSLRSVTGTVFDRAVLLGSVLRELEHVYDAWRMGSLTAVFEDIGPRDFLRGRPVTVDGASGVAVGITRGGTLEIEVEHGVRVTVTSGEVEFAR